MGQNDQLFTRYKIEKGHPLNLFTIEKKLSGETTRRACMTQKLVLPCCKHTEFVY
jgi:hypothetical protein